MTELQLYKFIKKNNIEWHKEKNQGNDDVLIFVMSFQIESFFELLKDFDFDEGINCRLKSNYLCVWMVDICEYFGIDFRNVFIDY